MQIRTFRDLIAWQKSMALVRLVYQATQMMPESERFGLTNQMRRSAVSIPSNIAEGSRHKTPGYTHHLVIALGSHAELDTQCELATRRRFIKLDDQAKLQHLIDEAGRIIHGLARSL